MGVAAHWALQGRRKANPAYEQKTSCCARSLNPLTRDGTKQVMISSNACSRKSLKTASMRYRLGEVIELPRGATPLDFAYHLHTDLVTAGRGGRSRQ